MTIASQIEAAISRSISHNESVSIEIEASDISAVVAEIDSDYETDYAKENDGTYDVWGWTEETPDNEQDWRLKITLTGDAE